jgi:hypothetical protein
MVMRDCPDGLYGKTGVIPNPPVVGTTYSTAINYTVPAQYNSLNVKLENLYLVAMVVYNNGEILNAEIKKLSDATPVLCPRPAARSLLSGVSVRASTRGVSLAVSRAGSYELTLHSANGRNLHTFTRAYLRAGSYSFPMPQSCLGTGMYFVRIAGQTLDQAEMIRFAR